MSWAAIAKSATAPAAYTEAPPPSANERIAVIDTNAIISGLRLENIADRFCTIPEVVAEVRDKQSRAFLSTLPFSLDIREPSEESIKAVQRFARETGDIHSLSGVDLKLLALAHTLEVAANGTENLRDHPVQVRTCQKHKSRPRVLPGWGTVSNPEDWKVVDEAPEDQLTNATGGQSRIIAAVQSLSLAGLDAALPTQQLLPPPPGQQAQSERPHQLLLPPRWEPEPSAESLLSEGPVPATSLQQPPHQTFAAAAAAAAAGTVGSAASQPPPAGPAIEQTGVAGGASLEQEQKIGSEEDEDDGGGWETACKSRNAARRKQWKARRHQVWLEQQQRAEQQTSCGAPSISGRQGTEATSAADAGAEARRDWTEEQRTGGGSTVDDSSPDKHSDGDEGAVSSGEAGDGPLEFVEGGEKEGGEEEEEFEEGLELVTDGDESEEEGEGPEGEEHDGTCGPGTPATSITDVTDTLTSMALSAAVERLRPNTTSNVFTITADFAMQNVMLQMGLRLVSRDGKQIHRVSRWALRCSACFFVTKDVGRLFCPRCGNMTMDKVEFTVGPDGAEFFGVRKKFILRGTRFSLPNPKSGRQARKNPVLREDVLLARTGALKGQRSGGASKKATGELDPFAPEFGSETWHQAASAASGRAGGRGGVPRGVLLTSWKNNPNEVKPQRKSRRK